jgi:hypothetical protein
MLRIHHDKFKKNRAGGASPERTAAVTGDFMNPPTNWGITPRASPRDETNVKAPVGIKAKILNSLNSSVLQTKPKLSPSSELASVLGQLKHMKTSVSTYSPSTLLCYSSVCLKASHSPPVTRKSPFCFQRLSTIRLVPASPKTVQRTLLPGAVGSQVR